MKVTEENTRMLRDALGRIRNGEPFICHALLDAYGINRWSLNVPEIVSFIGDGIQFEGSEADDFRYVHDGIQFEVSEADRRSKTFTSWISGQGGCALFGKLYDRAGDFGREAWLSKLVYLIEECHAVELYPSGSYRDYYGFFRHANGQIEFNMELQV